MNLNLLKPAFCVEIVIGTDPAGPSFQGKDPSLRLDPSDADFVDIVHSNQGVFGYSGPLGHVDFWINGMGLVQIQPGCSRWKPAKSKTNVN